jgi:hypothetical protein
MKYDVFISYRRKTGFLMAQVLKELFKEKGINCFLDLENERSGQFDENLFVAIKDSSNFILVLTNGSLDRCVNEADWVRKEYLEAIRLNKNIIPVRYPDFVFPQEKEIVENLPDCIKRLDTKQGVLLSQEYLPASIEKIKDYFVDVSEPFSNILQTDAFFHEGLKRIEYPYCIDMAFYAGAEWQRETAKVDILTNIIEKNIKLRIIINTYDVAESICSHMRQPLKKYVSLNDAAIEWLELSKKLDKNIEVRISDVPLLHRLYIIRGKDDGIINVKYYTYGNCRPCNDYRATFDSTDDKYKIYIDEFDYIWENASHI